MSERETLIPKHGGYRKLKSFQIAQLVYDVTVRFCDLYVDKFSRTRDQMVQAARSGVQNIAEGSQASGTSKKTELKLTNVARASLEELRLDYEDFLRQRGLALWAPDEPALKRFKAKRCATVDNVRAWVEDERRRNTDGHGQTRTNTDGHGQPPTNTRKKETEKSCPYRSVKVRVSQCSPPCWWQTPSFLC
jgi:four helix bundle protein